MFIIILCASDSFLELEVMVDQPLVLE